jgi:hypothetical protein
MINSKFSEQQLKTIDNLVEWIILLKDEPGYTNRLKIWEALRADGATGWLLLEAFRRTGLFSG